MHFFLKFCKGIEIATINTSRQIHQANFKKEFKKNQVVSRGKALLNLSVYMSIYYILIKSLGS